MQKWVTDITRVHQLWLIWTNTFTNKTNASRFMNNHEGMRERLISRRIPHLLKASIRKPRRQTYFSFDRIIIETSHAIVTKKTQLKFTRTYADVNVVQWRRRIAIKWRLAAVTSRTCRVVLTGVALAVTERRVVRAARRMAVAFAFCSEKTSLKVTCMLSGQVIGWLGWLACVREFSQRRFEQDVFAFMGIIVLCGTDFFAADFSR